MPYVGKEDCDLDCHEMESDGYMDLTLKFDAQEVAAGDGPGVLFLCEEWSQPSRM